RALVRAGPLGDEGRHPRRGEGCDLWVLAVRTRRGQRVGPRGRREERLRPWVHVLAPRRRGGGRARSPPRPRERATGRGQRHEGPATPDAPRRAVGRPPERG